jgi:hypothetical protein
VVVQTSTRRSAKIVGSRCHGIPSEVLDFERASKAFARSVDRVAPDVRESLRRYQRSVDRCDKLDVPRRFRGDVRALFTTGGVRAFLDPLRSRIHDFVDALDSIDPQDPFLINGTTAWDRLVTLDESMPPATANVCGSLRRWSKSGFDPDEAPADFDVLRVIRRGIRKQDEVIARTALHMLRVGVVRNAAADFTPEGILAVVDPKLALTL